MIETRRTPLYDLHRELGARMAPFAGWDLPIHYPAGILAEHGHCRASAALFDVSHMGQIHLHGADAAAELERLVPADIAGLAPGRARYTVFTEPEGGVLDDLIVSNAGDQLFLVVNAGGREQDLAHLRGHLDGVEELTDRALLALQGPAAATALARLAPDSAALRFMSTAEMPVAGAPCRVSRLGYTGEDGFEISVPADEAVRLARVLLDQPEVRPAGLGARDSLRLEAALCLYGHELDPLTSPVEAGLGWTIQKRRREGGGFPGAERILREFREGPSRHLVGLRPTLKAPAREGAEIRSAEDEPIGRVTSGGYGPTAGGPIALGYVAAAHAAPGTAVQVIVRGKPLAATVGALPFVPHRYHR